MNGEKYIELHAHLDGSITLDIAKKLAAMQGISLAGDDELIDIISVSPTCDSLTEFLKCFDFPLSLMQTKESISEAVKLVLDDMAAVGVVYAEIRFAPQLHTAKGLTQEEVIIAAIDGLNDYLLNKSDMKANLILCCMRGSDNENANIETVKLAGRYLYKGVVGLDLAGAEALYPTSDYTRLFEQAAGLGIPYTIHAGEAAGADRVYTAIDMGAVRIGHGIRAVTDDKLVKLIRDKGICLEMCPTSNRITKAVDDMSQYPLREYIDRGIKVTINTDDLAIVRTDISKEFEYAKQLANLTEQEVYQLKCNAAEASFADDVTKEWIKARIGRDND